jgi:tetratricopeptide (TPR) repeat protein
MARSIGGELRRWRIRFAASAAITLLFAGISIRLWGQTPNNPSAHEIGQLAAAQQWDEIVRRLQPLPTRSADMDFYYGSALAHLNRLAEADRALAAGQQLAPHDPRFPVERAGVAFKQKRYPEAARLLRRALRLAPADAYANDFLGTVYFLDGNLPAALKYWNRVGKPQINAVREDPVPRVSPALLDRAFAFSPAATLTLPQFLATESRVGGLGIFAQHQFDLRALPGGSFDIAFRSQERNGFGDTKLQAVIGLLSDLPFQGVTPEYDNIHRQAINFTSLFRWDAQKRRINAELSAPFEHRAKYRYVLLTDLRNENWALRNSFTGTAPVLASLNLRRALGGFALASFAGDRSRWSAGAELSHRDYRGVEQGNLLTPARLSSGYQLKQITQFDSTILRVPERRFTLDAGISSQIARLWSQPQQTAEKLQGSAGWHWFPQTVGDDYEMRQQLRAGKTFGQVPFDELFKLGLERDNDLPMHAHIGTRDGRKGSAPLGRNYFLHSWEGDKNLYSNGLIALKLGPVLDIGKITDPGTALGSHKWLVDLGAQFKVRVFSTTVALSYGRDLRTGNNAIYAQFQ